MPRNEQGLLDTFRFFNGPLAAGRSILAARGISLVVVCPAMREMRDLVAHTPDSFVALFAAGELSGKILARAPGGIFRTAATDLGLDVTSLPLYYGLVEGAWKHWARVWEVEYDWLQSRFDEVPAKAKVTPLRRKA